MNIDWGLLEMRSPPSADDIAKAIKKAKRLPDDGEVGKVICPFTFFPKALPVLTDADWKKAKAKSVKVKKLYGSTARIRRDNLVWHLQRPGQSRFKTKLTTHPLVFQAKDGSQVITDGHHRMSALLMLRVKSETAWVLKEKDL